LTAAAVAAAAAEAANILCKMYRIPLKMHFNKLFWFHF